jgi:hypothetical protein
MGIPSIEAIGYGWLLSCPAQEEIKPENAKLRIKKEKTRWRMDSVGIKVSGKVYVDCAVIIGRATINQQRNPTGSNIGNYAYTKSDNTHLC